MKNLSSKSLTWFLSLILLLAGCGTIPPQEQAELNTNLTTLSSCLLEPCVWNWNFLGPNPINQLPSTADSSSLAIASDGTVVVAYVQHFEWPGTYVKRWNGSTWVQYGDIVPGTFGGNNLSSMVLDAAGNPVVASLSYNTSSPRVWVSRWSNNAWVSSSYLYGCSYNSNDSEIKGFALDSSGQPIIACEEVVSESRPRQIKVSRWNGTTWTSLPPIVNAKNPRVAPVSNNGRFFVAYDDPTNSSLKVNHWNGSAWVVLGAIQPDGDITHVNLADLKLDAQQRPVMIVYERHGLSSPQTRLVVKKWNGTIFEQVGPSIEESCKCGKPELVANGNMTAVAYWTVGALRVKRYDATTNSWVQMGSPVSNFFNPYPSLAARPNGNLVIAWHGPGAYFTLHLRIFVKDWSLTPITRSRP